MDPDVISLRRMTLGSGYRYLMESVAVGDGRNDVSMIAWAGLGVSVEGSEPEVVAAADRTIPGPGHGGIQQLADLLIK